MPHSPEHHSNVHLDAVGDAVLDAELDRLFVLSDQLEQMMNAGTATPADVERAAQVNRDLLALLS
jgi:hypothetical protein